jgi:hypothetical protein
MVKISVHQKKKGKKHPYGLPLHYCKNNIWRYLTRVIDTASNSCFDLLIEHIFYILHQINNFSLCTPHHGTVVNTAIFIFYVSINFVMFFVLIHSGSVIRFCAVYQVNQTNFICLDKVNLTGILAHERFCWLCTLLASICCDR